MTEATTFTTSAPALAAVIGDVIGSRDHPDPGRLIQAVDEALAAVNEQVGAVQPLSRTIGDEFQGVYAHAAPALRATLLLRLRLVGEAEVRFGLGWGTIAGLEDAAAPLRQDGPAWWAAREAIDHLKATEGVRRSPRGRRTLFRSDQAALFAGAVNAHLVCRDELVAAMDQRDARIVLGLFAGRELAAIARDEGISAAAVSQRAIRGGGYALLEADAELRRAHRG